MILKRIGPLSLAKLDALILGVLGVFVGLIFSLFGLLGLFAGAFEGDGPRALLGLLFGVGAVVIFPVLYAMIGFIQGIIIASLYNLFARLIGGIELDLQ